MWCMCRSWLERQQNCPTCRNSVFAEAQQGQAGGNQAGDRARAVMREMHAQQHRDDQAAQQQDGAAPQEVSRVRPGTPHLCVFKSTARQLHFLVILSRLRHCTSGQTGAQTFLL